jgi:alanyl aminopeptidase
MSFRTLGAIAIVLLAACDRAPTKTEIVPVEDSPPRAELPEGVRPLAYRLELDVDPESARFSGRATIEIELSAPAEHVWMHGSGLSVERVTLDDERSSTALANDAFAQVTEDGVARLHFGRTLSPGRYRLHFEYSAPFGSGLHGLYRVRAGDHWYAVTQFEDISAREAFPSFDEPRFKTPFEIVVTAPAGSTVAGPTPFTSDVTEAGKRRVTFERTPPLPTYLIALAIGPWDVEKRPPIPASPLRPSPIPLAGLAVKGRGPELIAALSHTPEIVLEHERYFGIAYPYTKLDIAAVPDFEAGAMENVGLITFRDVFLLHGDRPTIDQHREFVAIQAHEVAHQWFGNLVTPRWWDDIWLNESFASWAGARTADAVDPDGGYRTNDLADTLRAMDRDSLSATRRLREPITSSDDIANAFDSITYSKGSGVLRMFEAYVGEDVFRNAVRGYLDDFREGTATADDFVAALATTANAPQVGAAFRSFIDRPGVPAVGVEVTCAGGRAELELTTQRYLPLGSSADETSGWKVPFCVRYGTNDGTDDACTMLESGESTMSLDACPTWLLPNRGGDGYYRWRLSHRDWEKLLAQYSRLSADEQLVIADSLVAGVADGSASVAELLDALPTLAAHGSDDALNRVIGRLTWLHARASGPARETLEARIRDAFGPRQRALATHRESAADTLLFDDLTAFLATRGGDEKLAAEMATRAIEHLAALREQPDLPHWDLLDIGLQAALESARTTPSVLVDLLTNEARAEVREAALTALARARTNEAAEAARTLLMSETLRTSERMDLLQRMFGPERIDGDWAWFTKHADALVERLPEFKRQQLPQVAAGFCSAERARDVAAFFGDRIDTLRGGERSLAMTLDAIRQCAAQLSFHRASLDALAARPTPH